MKTVFVLCRRIASLTAGVLLDAYELCHLTNTDREGLSLLDQCKVGEVDFSVVLHAEIEPDWTGKLIEKELIEL